MVLLVEASLDTITPGRGAMSVYEINDSALR
jgi:hypothetical protein